MAASERSESFQNDVSAALGDAVFHRAMEQFSADNRASENVAWLSLCKLLVNWVRGIFEVENPCVRVEQPSHYQTSLCSSVPCAGRSNCSPASAPAVCSKYPSGQASLFAVFASARASRTSCSTRRAVAGSRRLIWRSSSCAMLLMAATIRLRENRSNPQLASGIIPRINAFLSTPEYQSARFPSRSPRSCLSLRRRSRFRFLQRRRARASSCALRQADQFPQEIDLPNPEWGFRPKCRVARR